MAQINVCGLTFCYEGSYDNVFENVSFCIDTDWKLGFIGRNGKGKTTFLNLLLGKYAYQGSISRPVCFDYFPYEIGKKQMKQNTIDVLEYIHPDYELWKVCMELDLLKTNSEILYQPFETLSHGERTKVMLAMLFSRENYFLLIDEPTSHLDMPTREIVKEYLKSKKGFILVSHDRWLLDACIDHVLVLNRSDIEVEKGNFSSWWENKRKRDDFEKSENEKLKREIGKLKESARRTAEWADKTEKSKIGFNPTEEHDRFLDTRAYLGEKSRRMQQRRKNLERRQQNAIEDKTKLLKNIENPIELKLLPLSHHKEMYICCKNLNIFYENKEVVHEFHMELKRGERIILEGKNGCGKSSIIKEILTATGARVLNELVEDSLHEKRHRQGNLEVASGLLISYINQDTSHIAGSLKDYIEKLGVSERIFKAILRQLDFEQVQFDKNMEDYSEGQKKKVLITGSLLQQAHLYIWDEPLNYIDVFSRMQIEKLILKYQPTMLLVEHDKSFESKVATQIVKL
ncbi:ribosomal protection-like ABC-F family protein [Anaeromicropila populeti]|uniref:Lincosamide and streptogramin A transport system ATP-binding/permease protein n=1 Tax=Anaeromicropila populeti TaxID=37658 RepID=A0A1I6IDP2_9FIRM|nr:ATP-binding cassette domain-containing protein [Anaeromicropila populeti]SFR64852.1 lincosamide and streptogramin A transport system ATP-binding/permease protein [Anaeromicropila populeti]